MCAETCKQLFGGKGLVFLGDQDPASHPTLRLEEEADRTKLDQVFAVALWATAISWGAGAPGSPSFPEDGGVTKLETDSFKNAHLVR